MARRLRYIPASSVVEVTSRTIQSRFLLRPSPELNDLILGILGRAQARYQVEVHAFVFLSNHYHMLLSPSDAKTLAKFMEYINGNIAKEAGRLHKWRDKFWARPYQAIVVADEESQWKRLRYILAHGCKENLVSHSADWPGVNCVAALTEGQPLTGVWVDRSAEYEASRRRKEVEASAFQTKYPVTLTPLPCSADMSPEVYRQQCAALVDEVVRESQKEHTERPLGTAGVLQQHPHEKPKETERSPAPLVHAATHEVRDRFRAAYRWFVELYRAAAERLRQGQRDVQFPLGAFPPPAPFVTASTELVAATSPPS